MDQQEPDFKGQLKYERFQFFFRPHWMRFLQMVFFSLPLGLLLIVVLMVLGHLVLLLHMEFIRAFFVFFTMILTICFINVAAIQVINYYFSLVIVTDARILVVNKTVFLRNNSDTIDLTKIQDIGVEAHGIFRNYLKYGQLLITLSTSATPHTISYVPDPHFYLEWCNRVKREHIMNRRSKSAAQIQDEPSYDYLQDIHNLKIE